MKTAQEVRVGNVIMVGKDPLVVLKAEFSKSGRNASVVKMKLRNLLSGSASESGCPMMNEGLPISSSIRIFILSINNWSPFNRTMAREE